MSGSLPEGREPRERKSIGALGYPGALRQFRPEARLHRVAQSAFHFGDFGFVFGAEIHFHRGAGGNGIDRGAAFDDAEIERAARISGNGERGEFDDAARQSCDRIGRAEIGPAVAAGAADSNFEAVRRDALGGDVLGGSAVNCNHGRELRAVAFDQRANSAKISFAFFADVSGKDDCFLRANARFG